MQAYGDESGNLRAVLTGDEDMFVLAAVAGDQLDCQRCPKQMQRYVDNMPEVKWGDLTPTNKRRLLDCFVGQDLWFAYAIITADRLQSLTNSYLLYPDNPNGAFGTDWDLGVMGLSYFELLTLFQTETDLKTPPPLTFDEFRTKSMSAEIMAVINDCDPGLEVTPASSRQTVGIQAADCVAGAVHESARGDESWLRHIPTARQFDVTNAALAQVERVLYESG